MNLLISVINFSGVLWFVKRVQTSRCTALQACDITDGRVVNNWRWNRVDVPFKVKTYSPVPFVPYVHLQYESVSLLITGAQHKTIGGI